MVVVVVGVVGVVVAAVVVLLDHWIFPIVCDWVTSLFYDIY